jgi:hypothetical protein
MRVLGDAARRRWRRARVVRLVVAIGLIAGMPAAMAAPSGAAPAWSITPSASPPGPPSGSVSAVSCASATNCFAVGGTFTTSFIERWNGSTWSIVPSPHPAGLVGAGLAGVSCTSANSCFAVGSTFSATLIERWNGSSWSIVPSPSPTGSTEGVLVGVSCATSADCSAVGFSATNPESENASFKTLVEHWNGAEWSMVASPNPRGAAQANLTAVSCASTTSCFAVGDSGAGLLAERWNGKSWSIVPIPGPSHLGSVPAASVGIGSTPGLNGVTCPSATDCYAVGDGLNGVLVEHWNGKSWSIVAAPNPKGGFSAELSGVSCASPTHCAAVGDYATDATENTDKQLVEQWNGSRWSIVASPALPPAFGPVVGLDEFAGLTGVSCPSAVSCAAVGNSASVARWNGAIWSIAPLVSHTSQSQLLGVSCPSATDCDAVGTSNDATLAERWNGTRWVVVATAGPAGASDAALSGVSCPTTTECFAVGFATSGSGSLTKVLIERWNGTHWTIVASPNPAGSNDTQLSGVSCASASDCAAVGFSSTSTSQKSLAEHWNGTSWSIVPTPNAGGAAETSLAGVSCSSAESCMAVGSSITVSASSLAATTLTEHWDGTGWMIVASPSSPDSSSLSRLGSVSCTGPSDCTAVGYSLGIGSKSIAIKPLAEQWNGTAWMTTASSSLTSSQTLLMGVSCPAADNCTAVGDSATGAVLVEQWNGTSWATVPTTNPPGVTSAELTGVSCPDAASCYAVGASSTSSSVDTLAERGT